MTESSKIILNGTGDPFHSEILCKETSIHASPTSALDSVTRVVSTKLTTLPVSNFEWPYCYYPGNVVAVHKTSNLIAYLLPEKLKTDSPYQSMIRIFDRETCRKFLIKEIHGSVLTICFNARPQIKLAFIDSYGIFYLYNSTVTPELFTHERCFIIRPELNCTTTNFASLKWREQNEKDLILWSFDNSMMIFDVNNALAETSAKSSAFSLAEFSNLPVESSISTEHTKAITSISFHGHLLATASCDGRVCFYEKETNCSVKLIFEVSPFDGNPIYSCFLLSKDILLVGSEFNQQLAICDISSQRLDMLQKIMMKPTYPVDEASSPSLKVSPQIILTLDSSKSLLFMSDIKRCVLYCIRLGESTLTGNYSFLSISEFMINSPFISMEVTSVEIMEIVQNDSDISSLNESDSPENKWLDVKAQLYTIQPRTLSSRLITFKIPVSTELAVQIDDDSIIQVNNFKTIRLASPQASSDSVTDTRKPNDSYMLLKDAIEAFEKQDFKESSTTISDDHEISHFELDNNLADKMYGSHNGHRLNDYSKLVGHIKSPELLTHSKMATHDGFESECRSSEKMLEQLNKLCQVIEHMDRNYQENFVKFTRDINEVKSLCIASKPSKNLEQVDQMEKLISGKEQLIRELHLNQEDLQRKFNLIEQTLQKHSNSLNTIDQGTDLSQESKKLLASLEYKIVNAVVAQVKIEINNRLTEFTNTILNKIDTNMQHMQNSLIAVLKKDDKTKAMTNQIVSQLQTVIVNQQSEIIANQVVPCFNTAINELFANINTVFATGTQEYLSQIENKLSSFREEPTPMEENLSLIDPSIITAVCDIEKYETDLPHTNNIYRDTNSSVTETKLKAINALKATTSNKKILPEQASASPPAPEDSISTKQIATFMLEAHELIRKNKPVEALSLALNSTHQAFLLDVCRDIDRSSLFAKKVDQSVLLSLINQLSIGNFKEDIDLKVTFLQEAVSRLNPNDSTTAYYLNPLMTSLDKVLSSLISESIILPKNHPNRYGDTMLARLSTLSRMTLSAKKD